MSTSCVRRSVRTSNSRTRAILRRPMPTAAPVSARARRVPRAGRPLHRRARRGVLPPLRRPQGDARARADLRALRRADDARERDSASARPRTATGPSASSGGSPARATSATSPASTPRRWRRSRPSSTATSTARRSRSGCSARRSRTSPTATGASELEQRAQRAHRGAPEPDLPRAARARAREAVASSARRRTSSSTRRFGFDLDELAEQCRALARPPPSGSSRSAVDRLFRDARRRRRSPRRERWDIARLFRAPEWDEAFPADGMLPALEATLADLGIDLRCAAERRPRRRAAADEVAARVLLADRGARTASCS